MQKTGFQNTFFFHLTVGFAAGLVIFFLHYSIIFSFSEVSFTFSAFGDIHNSSPLTWLIDIIPFMTGGLAGINFFLKEKNRHYYESRIKSLTENKKAAIKMALGISDGKLSEHVNTNNDSLLESLKNLQGSIRENRRSEEARKEENRKRNWNSEGMAKFGSILREYSGDLETLSYKLISELVKYLRANQGGFFITEKEKNGEKYLNMLACYAYDRKKFADKKISWNDGIIGTTAMEKKSLYISDIPDNYLEITSGLGKSNPGYLLLTPLIQNDDVKGMLEIASFEAMDSYEIDFVEQVAEIVAMTLENIINSYRTEKLLQETRSQAEELAVQEEKMRQNMDELKATQEQAALQANKFISFSTTVNHTLIRAEYDIKGTLLYANTKFLRKLGYSGNREVEGKHISLFIDNKDQKWFDDIWAGLSKGGAHFEGYMKHITKTGQDLWTMATYTCMRRDDGSVEKILFLAIDTTEQKKQSLDFEGQMQALDKLSVKAEFKPDGKILNTNQLFINVFKYTKAELKAMTIFDFLDRKDLENYTEVWEKVNIGQSFQSHIRMLTKFKEEKWFRSSLTSVHDMYGEVSKVIFLANEITNEKIMENESMKQTEILKKKEEKFRLENLNLTRELQDIRNKKEKSLKEKDIEVSALEKILNNSDQISLVFDNSGVIIFLSRYTYHFLGIKREKKFSNTREILEKIPPAANSDFWQNLLDPAKPKNFTQRSISLPDVDSKKKNFKLKFHKKDESPKMIYTCSLVPK